MEIPLYRWIAVPGLHVRFGFYVDQLTVVMLLLITGISSLVHVYSVRYMQGDAGYDRFFLLLSLITWAITTVVLADNLLMLYFFWEIVGFGLYLLLAHQRGRPSTGAAARKALVINLLADIPFLLGVVFASTTFGTLDIHQISARAASLAMDVVHPLGWLGFPGLHVHAVTALALLLFAGAAGKSAQLPFHMWLPDTMDTPTPVSALMHAGIVNSGGFLIARLSPVFHATPFASGVVFLTGAATALYGTALMLAQPDVKRALGYSTMGQMGYMTMEGGLGAYAVSIFHLAAHGLFKASHFLGAGGSVMSVGARAPHDAIAHQPTRSQNVSATAAVAISAVLPVAGLVAADILLRGAQEGAVVLSLFAWATALWTASGLLRMGRVLPWRAAAFTGLVLAALAGTYVAGVGAFSAFLSPALPAPSPLSGHPVAAGIALGIGLPVVAGLLRALPVHIRQRARVSIGRIADTLYVLALNRGHEDELFDSVFVRPVVGISRWVDRVL